MRYKFLCLVLVLLFTLPISGYGQPITPVRVHYGGGGDWYGNKTTWVNILRRAQQDLGLQTAKREVANRIADDAFFEYPLAYIAGHGNIVFTDNEASRLRRYLESGGFLFADDDYGMDKSFRREMKKVFPELDFVELPFSHPIYHQYYRFKTGLPKVHEHDGGPPKGLGLIYRERLVCFYSFNTDLSDGCEDSTIHNDPPAIREQAMRMALNIVLFALTH